MIRDLAIAVAAGVVAALLSYTFGRLVLRPRLHCSDKIRIRDDSAGGLLYQFKIWNVSWARPIYDLRVAGVLIVPVTDEKAPQGREQSLLRIRMQLSATEALRLNYFQTRVIAVERADPTEFTKRRLEQLSRHAWGDEHFEDIDRLLRLDFLSPEDKASAAGKAAHLAVTCNCKDSFTGRDFSFVFGPFEHGDCKRGNFEGLDDNEVHWAEQRTVTRLVRWLRDRVRHHNEMDLSKTQASNDPASNNWPNPVWSHRQLI